MRDYLFIENLEQLKNEIRDKKYKQYLRLITQANSYKDMHLPEIHPPLSTTYMGIAIINLALAYKVSEDTRYFNEALRFIKTVCNYEVWGNAHLVNVDLSASWIMFGLSLAYDWLKDDFDKETRKIVFDKLVLQSKIMYDYKIETTGKGWSTNFYQNHNWINMCGLIAAGYALENEYEYAKDYIKVSKENFETVFELMADDGSNYEGVVYWRYGGMWLFIYAHLIKVKENIDFFKTSGYLKNTFYYRLYQSAADLQTQLNFGDCHDRYSGHAACVYYKAASEYNDKYAQLLGDLVSQEFLFSEAFNSKVKPGILPEACFELLWYNADVSKAENFDDLPKTKYFPDLDLISIRTGFKPTDTVFSFKCGYPGGKKQWMNSWKIKEELNYNILSLSHHHPDNLSFILNKGPAFFAIDDGYNRNIMPDNHNVLLVDGQMCEVHNVNDVYVKSINKVLEDNPNFDKVNNYYGEVQNFNTVNDITIFKAETAKIYKQSLKMNEVSRTVFTNNLDYIIMIDNLQSDEEHIYSTVFNSDVYPKVIDKNTFVYNDTLESMNYKMFSDRDIEYKTYEQTIKSVMTTQEPDKYCLTVLKTLSFSNVEKTKSFKFYQAIALNNDVEVTYHSDYIKITSDKYVDYIILKNSLNFESDADYIYINTVNNIIKHIGIQNGSNVLFNGKIVLKTDKKESIIRSELNEVFKF